MIQGIVSNACDSNGMTQDIVLAHLKWVMATLQDSIKWFYLCQVVLFFFFCSPYQEIRPDKGANGLAQMVISSGRLSQPLFSEKERIILLTI